MAENTYDALRDAIWNDDIEMLQNHMRTGRIDANHTDAAGQTLLHLAAFWGRTEIVRILISLGGSMKAKNATGCTALDLAIHWGHSATAEIIRLRGGTSVWEEKMGLLHMQVEDLTTTLSDVEKQNREQSILVAQQRTEIVALHSKWTAAVDQYTSEVSNRVQQEARAEQLQTTVDSLQHDIEELKQQLHDCHVEVFRIDRAKQHAYDERDAALTHRDEALAAQKAALDARDDRTRDWQAAERAAVIMETQRNIAFNERDDIKRRWNLNSVELELLNERLVHAQKELKDIQEEAADFLHDKRQEEIRLRRANRAVEEFTAEKKAAAMQVAKEMSDKQQALRRRTGKTQSKDKQREQRAQTAAAILSQQMQHDLHEFEKEFVHTIKTFTTDRQEKWIDVHRHNQTGRQDATRASLRPLFTQSSTTELSKKATSAVSCEVYGNFATLKQRRPNSEQAVQRRQAPLPQLRDAAQ